VLSRFDPRRGSAGWLQGRLIVLPRTRPCILVHHLTGVEKGVDVSARDELRQEIEDVSEPLAAEILDLVRFLEARASNDRFELALASESVLGKDWLRPEEDEAWRDL
jgi:hypothetical protein